MFQYAIIEPTGWVSISTMFIQKRCQNTVNFNRFRQNFYRQYKHLYLDKENITSDQSFSNSTKSHRTINLPFIYITWHDKNWNGETNVCEHLCSWWSRALLNFLLSKELAGLHYLKQGLGKDKDIKYLDSRKYRQEVKLCSLRSAALTLNVPLTYPPPIYTRTSFYRFKGTRAFQKQQILNIWR